MKQKLEEIRSQALAALSEVSDVRELEALKVEYLGKKGKLTQILKGMGKLSPEERPVVGQVANEIRLALEEGIQSVRERLNRELINQKLKSEVIDVTMPGKKGFGQETSTYQYT